MTYRRSDPDKGDLHRCRDEKCDLGKRKGRRYCNQTVWENLRLFGPIPRASQLWQDLYGM